MAFKKIGKAKPKSSSTSIKAGDEVYLIDYRNTLREFGGITNLKDLVGTKFKVRNVGSMFKSEQL